MAEKEPTKLVPLHKLDKGNAAVRKAKWAALKEEFIEMTITGRGVHWPTLAEKYGFPVETCRNKASVNKWYADIEERRKMREEVLEHKLTERTTMALDQLNQDFATNEAAIRKRHATMARGLQGRAITRLKEIPLSDFTARDALAMLKLGIDEERFAMGMSELYKKPDDAPADNGFQPIVEQIGGHQKVQRIGLMLLEALKSTTLDADMLEESGLGPTDAVPKYKPVPPANAINVTTPKEK